MLTDLLIILLLVLANGLFSGTEIAVISVRMTRLRELAEQGSGRARAVQALRAHPEHFFATVQIGITVVAATAAAFGGATIAARLEGPLRALGFGHSARQVALVLVVLLVSYLSLVLGELVPKSLALRYAEAYSLAMGRPMRALSWLARPLVWFLTASSNLVLRGFGDRTTFSESRLSREELQHLMEEAARTGTVHPRIGEIASRAFELARLTAADVMVPRPRVVMLRRHASPEDIGRVVLEEAHSRFPVYEGSQDNVVGYVIAKDLLAVALERELIVLEDILRPAYFVPESMPAMDLLQQMQARRIPMAVVVDEQGGLSGLITIEDLVEELVGEILSEHEVPEELIHREPDGTALVQATVATREVNRALGLDLPEGEGWSTVGGLCTWLAGAIPVPRTRLTAPDGTILEVLDASARRVKSVRLHPRPGPPRP